MVQELVPLPLYVPAKHVTHEAALVAPCVALALPAAHAVQAALPAALQ